MSRRVYISCDYPERDLVEVEGLCRFLHKAKCAIEWAPQPAWDFYRPIEEAIERCDAFVAVVATGYQCSTWLNHELYYAHALHRFRFHPRPRLFGIAVNETPLPNCSKHIPLEWLASPEDYGFLLEDLPPRT